MQLYNLGIYFCRRYGKILGEEYSQDEVYIRSTDHDRSIISALANLTGLYELTVIPVHTLPDKMVIFCGPSMKIDVHAGERVTC